MQVAGSREQVAGSRDFGDADAPPENAPAATAQTLVAEWIEHCRERPPGRVIGQLSKELKNLLDEGHAVANVRAGLVAWHNAGQHPSTLPSFVNAAMNATSRTNGRHRSTTDERVAMALEAGERAQAMLDAAAGGAP